MADPREILREAGVEIPDELGDFYSDEAKFTPWMADQREIHESFLALARLVAKYKAEAEAAYETGHRDGESSGYADWIAAVQDEVGDDFEPTPDTTAGLLAKYKWQRDECIADNHIAYQEIRDAALRYLERRWEAR